MEKAIRVKPKDDPVLMLMQEILIPLIGSSDFQYKNLPSAIKKEMFKLDSLYFEQWVNKKKKQADVDYYDDREKKLSVVIPNYTPEEYEKYVLLSHPIPSTLGRRAKESARRAYKTINGLLKSNIHLFKTFITLTIAPIEQKDKHIEFNQNRGIYDKGIEFEYIDRFDFEVVKECYTDMIRLLKKRLKKRGIPFEYIAVWELQNSGAYHIHMLSTEIPNDEKYKIPEWLDYDHRKKKQNNGSGLNAWTFGKSDVQRVTDLARLSTYVSKYIIKSFMNVNQESYEQYLNKKKYFRSYGLENTIEEYITDNDFEDIINENKVCCNDQKLTLTEEIIRGKKDQIIAIIERSNCENCSQTKSAYVKKYNNPYNQSEIEKRTYTLIEMDEIQNEEI